MLEDDVIFAWPGALIVAICLGCLFTLLVVLGEAALGEAMRLTREAVGLGLAAFIGYLVVVLIVRRERPS